MLERSGLRRLTPCVLGSAAITAPCFWLARVYAGDLSSHLYNAWLWQLAVRGEAEGISTGSQLTNVLMDRLLGWLFPLAGVAAAGRIAAVTAALVFGWGAFAFLCAVTESRPWRALPLILTLVYGFTFQMGLLNFYVSLGLCFWIAALLWRPSWARAAVALCLAGVALTAHSLPLAWCAGVLAFVHLSRALGPSARLALLGAAVACIAALRLALEARLKTAWYPNQLLSATGADQVLVFGNWFVFPAAALLALWLFLLLRRVDGAGWKLADDYLAQVCILTAAGIALVPSGIMLTGYRAPLEFIADRMSLAQAVCICALAATVPWRKFEKVVSIGLALVFFAFLYADQRAIEKFENRMDAAISALPPEARVVSAVNDPGSRVNALTHVIDRACVGRCFSYGNYEPPSGAFRVRTTRPNTIVTFRTADSVRMQVGGYTVQQGDPRLFEVLAAADGQLNMHEVGTGERTQTVRLRVLPF